MGPRVIALDGVPRRSIRVQRRRAEGRVILIRDGAFYELDQPCDGIWRAIDNCRTVRAIVQKISEQFELPEGDALALIVLGMTILAKEALIELPPVS
jgi:coenzyme PQQ synthesis protein D (PqqD)